ncbi:NADH oxidase, partial [Paenibacillus darwinianus]
MRPEEFIRCLHFETERARPANWETDWDNAPLPYKLYRRLPMFPFTSGIPLKLGETEALMKPDLAAVGHLLWYAYGLARVSQSVPEAEVLRAGGAPAHLFRRFAASGGGLYPNELYIYLRTGGWPRGIYHYDAAHHRLALLREGDFDGYAGRALGGRFDLTGCFGIVFASVMFRKNFYKYHNFSYRLQGLDTGLLIGQLLETARRLGYSAKVCFQFLDRAVNHLLGLAEREESVYAVIPLSEKPLPLSLGGVDATAAVELCRELPAVSHDYAVGPGRSPEYPVLLRMNEACMQHFARDFRQLEAAPRPAADRESPA